MRLDGGGRLVKSVCIKLIGRPCGKVSRMGGTDPDYTTLFLLKSLRPRPPAPADEAEVFKAISDSLPRLSDGPKADFLVKTQFGRDLHIVIRRNFPPNYP